MIKTSKYKKVKNLINR